MTSNIFPGMVSDATEFFCHEGKLKVIQNGAVKNFNELTISTIGILTEAIAADKEVQKALEEFHPGSPTKQTEQFAICRLGGLDYQGDITDGALQDGEYWPCDQRGQCKHEGIICKMPMIDGARLTRTEILLIQLSTTDKKNEVIAEELDLALGTFHQFKKFIHKKTGTRTKQQLTRFAFFYNLIGA